MYSFKIHRLKKIIILFIFVSMILYGYSMSPKAEIPMGANKFKSIKINYSVKGKYQNGYENFIQKNDKTYRETYLQTKILANTFKEHTLEIDDGVTFYRINLINNTGIKLPSLNKLKKEMIQKNPHLFKDGKHHPLRITPTKGKLKLKETIQGKECESYLHNNKIIYIWEDIILQEVWEVFGKTIKRAESLEINGKIKDKIFQVSKNIKFRDKKE